MLDILTKLEILNASPEHVIPAALGGKITDDTLLDRETNNRVGSTIELELTEALAVPRTGLGLTSRRGRALQISIEDPRIVLGTYLMPTISRRGNSITEEGTQVRIVADCPATASKLLAAAKAKHGAALGVGTVTLEREFVTAAFKLALGGPVQLRAIALTCFEYAGQHLPRELICSARFDHIRDWIWSGVCDIERISNPDYTESDSPANWDTRPEVWDWIPSLGVPYEHRLVFVSGPEVGGAWGGLELFGAFRFSCRLSEAGDLPRRVRTHIIDPVDGAQQDTREEAVPPTWRATNFPLRAWSLESVRERMCDLFQVLHERHLEEATGLMIETAMTDCLPAEGEMILPEHVKALTERLAREQVHRMFRLDASVTMSLAEWLGGQVVE